ncbi:potassium channel protein [Fervidobacterium pennivorans subsp. shakshaketiis]|jgi:voltage-gated potassium channel|uniref:potassium channel family protein n=1 Tax=Fervidobacterium pennivorans TaxID=93466 RepID=UPI001436C6E1|nr:potassium channel protein [Fervidobacterium pennivorans]QIV77589.1 potassium channel protein [Fervidobacterium pennivorans subsp. keratinolyticus]
MPKKESKKAFGTVEKNIQNRVKNALVSIFLIFLIGTLYYWLFEGYSLIDAMFFVGITISTVGYGMHEELSNFGKFFTLMLILAGLSVVLYNLSYVTALLVEGELIKLMKQRRVERKVSKMKDHIIVVGAGNIGTQVINQLLRLNEQVVAIDNLVTEEELREKITDSSKTKNIVFVKGDATNEEVLLRAGIKNARALVTTLPNDVLNIFVALTAKNLNANIYIVSNISNLSNLTKFIYAGVDHPIATAEIAGLKIVEALTFLKKRENIIDVLNISDKAFQVEIIDIKNTKLAGKKIEELRLKEKYNVYIIGLLKDKNLVLGPSKNEVLRDDSKAVLFGEINGLSKFREEFLNS